MKSYRIVWTKEDRVKHVQYTKFASEPVAKAYVEGCLDGLQEAYQEYVDVILGIDTRSKEVQDEWYKDPIKAEYGHQTSFEDKKAEEGE
tara:strand:+ start:2232 stop:2498 length:267 start_codon:yes stop_codon:yes gene_type:complete